MIGAAMDSAGCRLCWRGRCPKPRRRFCWIPTNRRCRSPPSLKFVKTAKTGKKKRSFPGRLFTCCVVMNQGEMPESDIGHKKKKKKKKPRVFCNMLKTVKKIVICFVFRFRNSKTVKKNFVSKIYNVTNSTNSKI